MRERLEEHRRGERRVHDHCGAGLMRSIDDRRDIDEPDERVGDHLDDHGCDVRPEDGGDKLAVNPGAVRRDVDGRHSHPEVAQWPRDERIRTAVAGPYDHDPRPRRRDHEGRREQQRRLSTRRRARERRRVAGSRLQLDHRLLEALRIAASVAPVHVASFHRLVHRWEICVGPDRGKAQRRHQVDALGIRAAEFRPRGRCGRVDASGHGQAGCGTVRKNGAVPAYAAASPSSCSIRNNRLYLATRSERDGAPVLIWPALTATARSAIDVSSVSPLRWLITLA